MLKDKLLKDVAVPIWYGLSNLVKLSVSEEAVLFYVSTIITTVCFVVDCVDELVSATKWAAGVLVGASEEPAVEEVWVDENLYLMPSQDTWEVLSAELNEVLAWWQSKASWVCDEICIDAEFWSEEVPQLVEGSMMLCLPSYKRRKGIKFLRK